MICKIPWIPLRTEINKKYAGVRAANRSPFLSLPAAARVGEMSSYGQHAPSSSFQQDSALVAQFASYERDHRSIAPSDISEEFAAWNDTIPYESRPNKPTIGRPMQKPETYTSTNERAPLIPKPPISRINETYEGGNDGSGHGSDYRRMFFDEVKTLARYTLPVFGCAPHFLFGSDLPHPVSFLPTGAMSWRYCGSLVSRRLF